MPSGAFLSAAGFGLSHVDKMVLATVDLLKASTPFMEWCEGRCRRRDLARFTVNGTAPFIAVGAVSWDTEFKVGCSEKTVVIGTVFVYETPLDDIGDDEPTESILVERWEPIIANNSLLTVPRFGNAPLAAKLESFGQVALDAGDKDSTKVRIIQTLQASYLVPWNTRQGRFEV